MHPSAPKPLPDSLFKSWVHAHEEDEGQGIEVYRPSTFELPPSRGRRGFTIHRNGELLWREIGPADGYVDRAAKWRLLESDEGRWILAIEGEEGSTTLELLTIEEDRLRVRPGE